jgi:hypothetical protein
MFPKALVKVKFTLNTYNYILLINSIQVYYLIIFTKINEITGISHLPKQ